MPDVLVDKTVVQEPDTTGVIDRSAPTLREEHYYRTDLDLLQDVKILCGELDRFKLTHDLQRDGEDTHSETERRIIRRRHATRELGIKLRIDGVSRRYGLNEESELIVCVMVALQVVDELPNSLGRIAKMLGAGRMDRIVESKARINALIRKEVIKEKGTEPFNHPVISRGIYEHIIDGKPLPGRIKPATAAKEPNSPRDVARRILKRYPTPRALRRMLDRFVIGQGDAKVPLSTAAFQNLRKMASGNAGKDDIKHNIILIGPTGCGKTHLVKTLAENLGLPYSIGDATTWTEEGYVGSTYDEVLWRLYEEAGMNLGLARSGIVYIDEIDKIAAPAGIDATGHGRQDVGGLGVQRALLKALEGSEIRVFEDGLHTHMSRTVLLDTSNIFFIIGGAFTGIENMKRQSAEVDRIGFVNGTPAMEAVSRVTHQDLIDYGMMREFVGRIPTIAPIHQLTNRELAAITTKGKHSLLAEINKSAHLCGLKFNFTRGAVEAVVAAAAYTGTGARALRGILGTVMGPYLYRLTGPNSSTIQQIRIDRQTVEEILQEQQGVNHAVMP